MHSKLEYLRRGQGPVRKKSVHLKVLWTFFKNKNISKKLKLRLKNTTIDKTLTYA